MKKGAKTHLGMFLSLWKNNNLRLSVICLAFSVIMSGCTFTLLDAAADGDAQAVVALLQRGADVNASFPVVRTHPLMVAAAHGHVDTVRALLDAGANVNTADITGWTPLHAAAYNGNAHIVNLLVERGAIAPPPTWFLQSPSVMAEKLGHKDIVPLLKQAETQNTGISALP